MMNFERPKSNEEILAPVIKELPDCEFPIVESEIEGYKVIELPEALRVYFDEEGFDAIRINSREVALQLPDYGGGTTSGRSLLPHQDHHPRDRRRFLALSQTGNAERGSSTYLVKPELLIKTIPSMYAFFNEHRESMKEDLLHGAHYQISKEDLEECFTEHGIERVLARHLPEAASEADRTYFESGLLTYLIQGEHADHFVEEFLANNKQAVVSENWEREGVFIMDNSKVFHGRYGDNTIKLKRNWCV